MTAADIYSFPARNVDAPKAHFYHANGFPPLVYTPFLQHLSQRVDVVASAMRPCWEGVGAPPKRRDWELYAQDLIDHLQTQDGGPVIGIGHSMGATITALAARQRPDLFSALVLIEPAMVSPALALLMKCLPKSLVSRVDPARVTLSKPDRWAERADFEAAMRSDRTYKRFSDEAMSALLEHAVVEDDDGVRRRFPIAWEAHNYTQPPHILPLLRKLPQPMVAVRGRPSVFFSEAMWASWRRRELPADFSEALDYGHLLPLEAPERTSQLVFDGLNKLGILSSS